MKAARDCWSSEEDTKLAEAVGRLGAKWKAVCAHVQGRDPHSCADRWNRHLSPRKQRKAKALEAKAKAEREERLQGGILKLLTRMLDFENHGFC